MAWLPTISQLELLISHQRQLLPVSETARQLGVSVTTLESFVLWLERGRAASGGEEPTRSLADEDDAPLPSGFPAMMRGR